MASCVACAFLVCSPWLRNRTARPHRTGHLMCWTCSTQAEWTGTCCAVLCCSFRGLACQTHSHSVVSYQPANGGSSAECCRPAGVHVDEAHARPVSLFALTKHHPPVPALYRLYCRTLLLATRAHLQAVLEGCMQLAMPGTQCSDFSTAAAAIAAG